MERREVGPWNDDEGASQGGSLVRARMHSVHTGGGQKALDISSGGGKYKGLISLNVFVRRQIRPVENERLNIYGKDL